VPEPIVPASQILNELSSVEQAAQVRRYGQHYEAKRRIEEASRPRDGD
jgi:hypothetical protein